MKKETYKSWARLFGSKWGELFNALTATEKEEVVNFPDGFQAQNLNRRAGEHASFCFNNKPKKA